MLNWVFGKKKSDRKKKSGKKKPPYEKAREIAAKGTIQERTELAAHEDLEPEILYYFATDDEPEVRRQVARNEGTPLQADLVLAKDKNEEVRKELAYKIGRLVPELTDYENEKVTTMAMEVLEILAQDQLPQVRAIIAEEIKRADNVPHRMVLRLAEDVEGIVSAPILEYSPLLTNEDLLGIIAVGVSSGTLEAVSKRKGLDAPVADAIVVSGDSGAVSALLENDSANIGEATFDKITDQAPDNPQWHPPLVNRSSLSVKTIKRIASFVSAALVEKLISRNSLQDDIVDDVRKSVRKRIERGDLDDDTPDIEPADQRAKTMYDAGTLTEEIIDKALSDADNAFVRHSLVHLSQLPADMVSKMLNTQNAKGVVAVAWKSGLSMDMACKLQTGIGRIKKRSMINPKDDGGYPITEADLDWYIEFFSV